MPSEQDQQLISEMFEEIERKYEPEMAFRGSGKTLGVVISAALVAMSLYHIYSSGFGLIRKLLHRGIFLAFMLDLVFLLFLWRKTATHTAAKPAWYRVSGGPAWDIVFATLGVIAALYLPLLPPEILSERVGNPSQWDVLMGTFLLVLVLEATRRSVGPTLPIIALLFIGFAIFGPRAPGT